jgi:hypothetical protein
MQVLFHSVTKHFQGDWPSGASGTNQPYNIPTGKEPVTPRVVLDARAQPELTQDDWSVFSPGRLWRPLECGEFTEQAFDPFLPMSSLPSPLGGSPDLSRSVGQHKPAFPDRTNHQLQRCLLYFCHKDLDSHKIVLIARPNWSDFMNEAPTTKLTHFKLHPQCESLPIRHFH